MPMPTPTTTVERELRTAQAHHANACKALPAGHPKRHATKRNLQALKAINAIDKQLRTAQFTEAERSRLFNMIASAPVLDGDDRISA